MPSKSQIKLMNVTAPPDGIRQSSAAVSDNHFVVRSTVMSETRRYMSRVRGY